MENDVKFIRVNGKVVPIRDKKGGTGGKSKGKSKGGLSNRELAIRANKYGDASLAQMEIKGRTSKAHTAFGAVVGTAYGSLLGRKGMVAGAALGGLAGASLKKREVRIKDKVAHSKALDKQNHYYGKLKSRVGQDHAWDLMGDGQNRRAGTARFQKMTKSGV
jgi:hypothetical protein